MRKITPSQALERLKNFTDRIDRLESGEYSNKMCETFDLNRLKREFKYIHLLHSIALFNKNKERATEIISACKIRHKLAIKYL